MKHEKDSKELVNLIKAFENAEQKVNNVFQHAKTESQLRIIVDKQVKINEYSLIQGTKDWSEKELPIAFKQGYESVKISPEVPQTTRFDISQSVLPFVEISGKVHSSLQEFTSTINQKIDELEKKDYVTIETLKDTILDAVGGGTPTIKYQNGANMPISKYAEMLARTSRIETANGGVIARCKDINHDLVRYMALPSCCPRCQRFHNKVFSVSGTDTRFPYLYGNSGPFKGGYNITHPNCRCEIMPFIDSLHQNEIEQIIKDSNHFTNYLKSDKMFDEYNRQQAYNRQRNSELVEYLNLKQQLGKDFPYKRLGDFRRAKHQNSEIYQKTRQSIKQLDKKEIDGGLLEHIDISTQLSDKLMEYQDFLKDKEIEYSFIIQSNGDVFRYKGDAGSVVSDDESINFDGAIDIHNHPPQNDNGFSRDDFEYMQKHQGAQYILFTKSFTYTATVLKDISKLNYYDLRDKARATKSIEEIINGYDENDLIYEYLKEMGYVDYEKY